MSKSDIIKFLENEIEKVMTKNIIVELTKENISDFSRGKIAGKIDCLHILLNKAIALQKDNESKK